MSSISTRRGDGGDTATSGGPRVSKSDLRVEAYGTIDELNCTIGLARAWCDDPEIAGLAKAIQRDLFAVGSAVSTKPESKKPIPAIEKTRVATLDAIVERFEAVPGMLRDWSISGEMRSSAAFDLARTVARRAERATVRLVTSGVVIQPTVLEYLNRLSDVMWLFARKLERDAGVDARLRDDAHPGPPWSRAW
jgi:cob(I)alamin adenosyltransferase